MWVVGQSQPELGAPPLPPPCRPPRHSNVSRGYLINPLLIIIFCHRDKQRDLLWILSSSPDSFRARELSIPVVMDIKERTKQSQYNKKRARECKEREKTKSKPKSQPQQSQK
ncbi:hypothetical protein Tco_1263833 [Tanacetum coccineum]